jgi:putative endopeptidase
MIEKIIYKIPIMKNRFIILLVIVTSVFAILSCNKLKKDKETDALVSHVDSTIKAGNDFFLFANGKWFRQHPIPASEQSNGTWQLIQDTINAQIRHVCESSAAIKNALKGSNKQKIGDFLYSGMDSITLNSKGITDLKSDFDMIDAIKDVN